MVYYNAALAITNTITGIPRVKLYKELGIDWQGFCWRFRRLCTFYKIKTQGAPKYPYKLILFIENSTYNTPSTNSVGI